MALQREKATAFPSSRLIQNDCILYTGVPASREERWRIVRRLLADRLGRPESKVRLVRSRTGQPLVEHEPGVTVSWAHRSGFLVVALGREPIGVDLELADHSLPLDDVADAFFSRRERRALRRMASGTRAQAFILLWTLREAYLKALGEGLDSPIAQKLDVSRMVQREGEVAADLDGMIYGPGCVPAAVLSRLRVIEHRLIRLTSVRMLTDCHHDLRALSPGHSSAHRPSDGPSCPISVHRFASACVERHSSFQ